MTAPLNGAEIFVGDQAGETRTATAVQIAALAAVGATSFSGARTAIAAGNGDPGGAVQVTFAAIEYDTDSYWVSGDPTVFTVPFPGYYALGAFVAFDPAPLGGTGQVEVRIASTGHDTVTMGGDDEVVGTLRTTVALSGDTGPLLAGDTVGLWVDMGGSSLGFAAALWARYLGDRPAVPPVPPTPVLLDEFVDTDGTELTVHTMDIGPGWTEYNGAVWQIQSDQAALSNTASPAFVTSEAGVGNCLQIVRYNIGTSRNMQVVGRFTDPDNCWYVNFRRDTGNIELHQVTGGVDTVLQSNPSGFGTDTDYVAVVLWNSDTVSFNEPAGSGSYTFSPMLTNLSADNFGFSVEYNDVNEASLRVLEFTVFAYP
jgi:hypothetical protein